MSMDAISLPNDVSLLKGIIAQQQEVLVNQQHQIGQLEYRLDQLLRRFYGPRAERVDPNQLSLFDLETEKPAVSERPVEEKPESIPEAKKKRKG